MNQSTQVVEAAAAAHRTATAGPKPEPTANQSDQTRPDYSTNVRFAQGANLDFAADDIERAVLSALINDPEAYDKIKGWVFPCLLYTSPSPRDRTRSRMPSSA